jgi:CheY-like chemotaxis protein
MRGGRQADLSNVRPIHPLRVLLVGRDKRYLRVTSFLLARQGFEVESGAKPDKALDLVDRHHPSVVVLEAESSLAACARTAATLKALYPRIGVVVVTNDGARRTTGLRTVAKWSPIERLIDEVELAYIGLPTSVMPLTAVEEAE